MIVTTGNEITGRSIASYIGIVRGIVVRSPSIAQGFLGGLKQIVGGNIESYAEVCEVAREEAYQRMVEDWGFWFIIAKAFTPLPFKIAAIAAGAAAMNPVSFMIAAVLGRALHFAMVGALLVLCGDRILALVARYERPCAVIAVLALIALFVCFHLR